MQFITIEEGRIRNNGSTYVYEYDLKDHLGNTRVSIQPASTDPNQTTAEVVQENSYYAFGMDMPNMAFNANNKYLYNGKELQTCIIHQIRNSLKYIPYKDQKPFMKDLKLVYKADTLELAELRLEDLEAKWGQKYEKVIDSWRRNWPKLSTYFRYDTQIRKMIYTTNAIEGFHRQIRKVTKTKGAFTSDMALLKLIYLAQKNISQKWTMPLLNWAQTAQKLAIWFPDRMRLDLN